MRLAHGYAVDAPGGEVGRVAEIRVAPFEFWPEAIVVCPEQGSRLLVPVSAIVRALPRGRRLVLGDVPPGAEVVPHPAAPSPDRERLWQLFGAAGFAGGVGGCVAIFVTLALGAGLAASPIIAAAGALGVAASGIAWSAGRRTWLVAAGLGSAWFPLAVGAILSLVWILR